ncbi:uncharacterized protein LOC143149433 isoform X2 [Ptiloglossa arizonensis]|uniref:uncharacterized protein LOC143149433 isoform X2 n=1 Tax=Ptiloglossa arizonensis TaxID=3350558 RepID=UPI003F9F7243
MLKQGTTSVGLRVRSSRVGDGSRNGRAGKIRRNPVTRSVGTSTRLVGSAIRPDRSKL